MREIIRIFFNLEHNVPKEKVKIPKELTYTLTKISGGIPKTGFCGFPKKFRKKVGVMQDFLLKDYVHEYVEKKNKGYRVTDLEFVY